MALLSIAIGGYYIFKIIKLNKELYNNKFLTISLIIAYYSTPFFWYTGKIITPEFYLISIILYSYYKIFAGDYFQKKSWFLFGLALGIKMNAIFTIFPIILYILTFLKQSNNLFTAITIKKLFKCGFIMFLGFILASPDIIFDNSNFIIRFQDNGINNFVNADFLQTFYNNLFIKKYAWDLIIYSGLELAILPIFSIFLILFIAILNKNYIVFYINFLSIILVFLILFFQKFYIWYAFSLAIFPITFCIISFKKSNIKHLEFLYLILTFIIIMNSYTSFTTYLPDHKLRTIFSNDIKSYANNTACLNSQINLSKFKNDKIFAKLGINYLGNHYIINGIFDYNLVKNNLKLETIENKENGYFNDKKTLKILHFTHNKISQILKIEHPSFDFLDYKIIDNISLATCNNININLVSYERK